MRCLVFDCEVDDAGRGLDSWGFIIVFLGGSAVLKGFSTFMAGVRFGL